MEQLIQQTSPLADIELIDRILAGEKNLFEAIIRRYNQRLYRVGMAILGDDTETEDAMQNSYIKAYEHLAAFERRSAFGTWLTRIMVNECLAQKNKNRHTYQNVPQTENVTNMATPDHLLANKELSSLLEDAIGQLPEKYRLVFMLREIEEMSVRETGEALHIEESNVKVRLNRARTMLQKNLNGYMKDHVYAFHLTRCDRIVGQVMSKIG
jgi:RNA polymerase sigma factor (sigma-70 family)